MITLFLRFPNLPTALGAFGVVTGQAVEALSEVPSKVAVNGLLCDVDVIGSLTHETGEKDADGAPVFEPVAGFHVNIWVPDDAVVPAELEPFRVFPVTPSRSFG